MKTLRHSCTSILAKDEDDDAAAGGCYREVYIVSDAGCNEIQL